MRKILLNIFVSLSLASGNAQNDSLKHRFIKPAVSVVGGIIEFDKKFITRSQMETFASFNSIGQFAIKNGTTSDYEERKRDQAAIYVSFRIYGQKPKPINDLLEFRIGLTTQSTDISFRYMASSKHACDTLISAQSPKVYYIDTVKNYRWNFSYQSNYSGLNISNTIHSKQNRFISLYTGYNLEFGLITDTRITTNSYFNFSFEDQNGTSFSKYYTEGGNEIREEQIIKFGRGSYFTLSVPIGFVLRPAAKNVSRISLTGELRGGYLKENTPGLGTYKSHYFQASIGAKIFIFKEKTLSSFRYKGRASKKVKK